MSKLNNLVLCSILLTTVFCGLRQRLNGSSFIQLQDDAIPMEEFKQICPTPQFTAQQIVDDLILSVNSKAVNERAGAMANHFRSASTALNTAQLTEVLTKIQYGEGLRDFLQTVDPVVFRIDPSSFVTILQAFPHKQRLVVLEELSDCLTDNSEATKRLILDAFKCKKHATPLVEKLKVRDCIIGKSYKNNVIILDLSGSMDYTFVSNGQTYKRLAYIKAAMINHIKNLPQESLFNLVVFNSGAAAWKTDLVPANDANKAEAVAYINKMKARGWTNINKAVEKALSFATPDYHILLNTDGYPSKGVTKTSSILANIEKINEKTRPESSRHSVKIDVNLIMMGGKEDDKSRLKAFEVSSEIARKTGGAVRNFNI